MAVQPLDCRCLCGSLVARMAGDGIELKCRRCKRVLVVPWRDLAHAPPATAASGPVRPRAPERARVQGERRELAWSGPED